MRRKLSTPRPSPPFLGRGKARLGLTLVEALWTMVILLLLMGVFLGAFTSSARGVRENGQRSFLSDAVTFTATVLSREIYPVGYGLSPNSSPLVIATRGADTLSGAFLCDEGTSAICLGEGVRRFTYTLSEGRVLWGACFDDGSPCTPLGTQAALGGNGVEVLAFRLAHRSGGAWTRGPLSTLPPVGVEQVALYLLARVSSSTGTSWAPGSTVVWPPGLSLSTFGLGNDALPGGYAYAERLVLVQTPNLRR